MFKSRPPLISAGMAVVIGSIGLFGLMAKPRFADIHTVDVVQLLGSGACFGVAMCAIAIFIRMRKAPDGTD
jgi:hypothetical protein